MDRARMKVTPPDRTVSHQPQIHPQARRPIAPPQAHRAQPSLVHPLRTASTHVHPSLADPGGRRYGGLIAIWGGVVLQRWRSLRSPAATGTERANRFVAILLGLQRLSYFVPALLSMGSDAFASRALNVGLVLATIAWNVWLFWRVAREGWFRPSWVWADVAWTCLLVLVVTENSGEAYDQSSVYWSGRMGQAAAALAGGAFDRIAISALALGVLLVAHAAATIAAYAGEPGL